MNRSKQSILTAMSSIALTFVNGIFAIIVTRLIILKYGSDFNGLNSTASQFISMLLIVEGGFTIATNVALFKPISENNQEKINRILSATRKTFNKIGLSFFIIGSLFAILYSFVIKSELSPMISFLVLFMTILSTTFNLSYATKYRILLQSEHKEYILNGIQVMILIISQVAIMISIFLNGHMLFVRLLTMIGAILSSLVIIMITKNKYGYLDFHKEPDFESIKGTKDIFFQKITSMVYSTIPVIFISATVGTVYASVYVVYNNVFRLLKSVIYAFINAPRMGFGKLIAEKDSDYVLKVFLQYEFIVNFVMLALLSTAAVLIMPFIKIYTDGVTDVNYYNSIIAAFLIFITFFEIIHIPSGNIINMAGKFKIGRNIQFVASVVLVIFMVVSNYFMGFYGILLALLVTAILLATFEITYIHVVYFKNTIFDFLKILIPSFVVMTGITFLEIKYLPPIDSYVDFLLIGTILVLSNILILALVNFLTNNKLLMEVVRRLKNVL
jgi:O-antigen/teichoic acid export membrane protein